MFKKIYEVPEDVLAIEALTRRVRDQHKRKNEIIAQHKQNMVGQQGEKEVSYQLRFLPEAQFGIFHNLRLFDYNGSFQQDFSLTSRPLIIPLEVKNFKGKVYSNDYGQLIVQKEDGRQDIYPNPISQVERHAFQLQNWLYQHHFPEIPIVPLVVFGPSSTISDIASLDPNVHDKTVSYSNLVARIKQIAANYSKPVLDANTLNSLNTLLLKHNQPKKIDCFKQFGLRVSDFKLGIFCPNCGALPMRRDFSRWVCPKCGHADKLAHIPALNDYYLIMGETITNKQAREFLQLDNRQIVKYLLNNLGYEKTGKNAGTKYILKYIKQ